MYSYLLIANLPIFVLKSGTFTILIIIHQVHFRMVRWEFHSLTDICTNKGYCLSRLYSQVSGLLS